MEEMMQALSVEKSILEGKVEVNELFDFVKNQADNFEAYEMEYSIFQKLQQIGLAAMKCYFATNGTGDVGAKLVLDDGIILKKQSDLRSKVYFSIFGKINVPRTYYFLRNHPGVTPLDAQANLPDRSYSYLLQEWMDILSIRNTFDDSETTLEKLLNLKVCSSRFEVVNRETSIHYDAFYKEKKKPNFESEGEINIISFDGKGVPVIKKEAAKLKSRLGKGEKRQKKKEALVGVSYTINRKIRSAEEVAENLIFPEIAKEKKVKEGNNDKEAVKAMNVRRLASLKRSKEEVVKEIVNDAKNRSPDNNQPWVVLMDGALHLWTLISNILYGINYVGILDIIHVTEYLWKIANELYKEGNPKRIQWVYSSLLLILQGRVKEVTEKIRKILSQPKLKKSKKKVLEQVIKYFENHYQWMKYDEYLKAGFPIGTGVVESACGHTVKDRMEGTGKRWSIDGAESTLLLRSIYTSGDWEAYWNCYMILEKERIYGETLKDLNNNYKIDMFKNSKENVNLVESQMVA